jgi:antitoxin VapB
MDTPMAFHIRNLETDRLARRVAALKRTGLTEAVHSALEHELERVQGVPSLVDRIAEFRKRVRALGNPKKGKPADKAFFDDLSGDV